MKNKSVKVTPEKWVEHTRLSDLVKIKGYRNYYVNLVNGNITYRKGSEKDIHTGTNEIRKAEAIVKEELIKRSSGVSDAHAGRIRIGETNPTLESIWKELVDLRQTEKSPATLERYATVWKNSLAPFWSKKTVLEVTPQNIDAFGVWYLKHRGNKIFDRTFIYLKMLLSFAHEREYIKSLPLNLDRLEALKETVKQRTHYKKAGRVATKEECEALVNLSKDRPHIELAILLALTMGLRKMEACSLEWSKVDLNTGFVEVWSKNKHWRRVPISFKAKEAFIKQKKITGNYPYVFAAHNDPTTHMQGQVMDHLWVRVKREAGIKNRLRFHDLRHTFATMTAEENWPPVIACKVLDMSLRVYQSVYCKPSDEKIAEYFRAQDRA